MFWEGFIFTLPKILKQFENFQFKLRIFVESKIFSRFENQIGNRGFADIWLNLELVDS